MLEFIDPKFLPNTAEKIIISPLALLKMIKHGRLGIPMEVMGLMLGSFVDDCTIKVVDVFAMPQSATGVNVEAIDPVFQTKMMEMLKMIGRDEKVVGWYHSHPGFGCWLSNVDVSTQQAFEKLDKRSVAVVIDPVQSVKGKVVIDAFRSISTQIMALGIESREVTSNAGVIEKPSLVAILHGLNRNYYSLNISHYVNSETEKMLLNLNRKTWQNNLINMTVPACDNEIDIEELNDSVSTEEEQEDYKIIVKPEKQVREAITLYKDDDEAFNDKFDKFVYYVEKYLGMIKEVEGVDEEQYEMYKIGKVDYKKHLLSLTEEICSFETINCLLAASHMIIMNENH